FDVQAKKCFQKGFILKLNSSFIMPSQLQQLFTNVAEEVILQAWNYCNENFEETATVLTWIAENTTNSEQQSILLELFKDFGTKIEKTIILQTWRNFNHFYYETREKLTEICFNCNINELN
ncbi:hypothetical protein RFI_26516, partial [Reticulomyxa filosa]